MAINLSKNMKFKLDKDGDKLLHIRATLNWDGSIYNKEEVDEKGFRIRKPKFDADLTLAVLETTGKREDGSPKRSIFCEDEQYLVYYGNEQTTVVNGQEVKTLNTPNKEIVHSGDDRTGAEGETAEIYLDKMPDNVDEIAIVGTIHKGESRGQNWNVLRGHLIIENIDTNEILAEYDLGAEMGEATAISVGSIYRTEDGGWEFQAIGQGYKNGLQAFIDLWS